MPDTYTTYFVASVGASAALIGLLFVAVTVAPERIFGRERTIRGLILASSAFMALLDAFFISLIALIPGANIGYAALVMGILALFNTASMGRTLWEDRRHAMFTQGLTILIGAAVVYTYEVVYGAKLVGNPHDSSAVLGLSYLLLGAYSLGVARTWMLLGGEHQGFLGLLGLIGTQPGAEPGDAPSHSGARPAPRPAGGVPPEHG